MKHITDESGFFQDLFDSLESHMGKDAGLLLTEYDETGEACVRESRNASVTARADCIRRSENEMPSSLALRRRASWSSASRRSSARLVLAMAAILSACPRPGVWSLPWRQGSRGLPRALPGGAGGAVPSRSVEPAVPDVHDRRRARRRRGRRCLVRTRHDSCDNQRMPQAIPGHPPNRGLNQSKLHSSSHDGSQVLS